jgi:gamma-polyglutamate biosynthesis protein CapA
MRIALLGDIAFFRRFSIKENDSIFDYFRDVKEALASYDYIIANLETPFINRYRPRGFKSAYIGSDIVNVGLLKYLGITTVSLANNHIFDFGIEGLALTKKILTENGISFFGIDTGSIIIEDQFNKVEITGYCCFSTNPTGTGRSGVRTLNFNVAREKIEYNMSIGINSILSVHAGQEHVNYPNPDHIQLARQLAECAPYVYYGHHPHVLQGIEKNRNSLLAYSLGNFCFDDVYTSKSELPLIKQSYNNKSSVILGLEYQKNALTSHSITPIFAGEKGMDLKHDDIINNMKTYSEALSLNKDEYRSLRNGLLTDYINSRKALRNFEWYRKRLNHRYLMIIISSRINKIRYKKGIVKYLERM